MMVVRMIVYSHSNVLWNLFIFIVNFFHCIDLGGVRALTASGVNLNSSLEWDGRTPLHLAASAGHFHIVKYLVLKVNKKLFNFFFFIVFCIFILFFYFFSVSRVLN